MKIALLHAHHDTDHLEEVRQEMLTLGAPKIHAVWMECHGHWAALEGCHRLRAAHALGVVPQIIEMEYSDDFFENPFDGFSAEVKISEVCDASYKAEILDFSEARDLRP